MELLFFSKRVHPEELKIQTDLPRQIFVTYLERHTVDMERMHFDRNVNGPVCKT